MRPGAVLVRQAFVEVEVSRCVQENNCQSADKVSPKSHYIFSFHIW